MQKSKALGIPGAICFFWGGGIRAGRIMRMRIVDQNKPGGKFAARLRFMAAR
jgi:hypothetical protein